MIPPTSPRQRLRELAAAITIGTDRTGDGPAVEQVLTEAARVGLQARAGWRPQPRAVRLPPCPDDSRPTASPAAHAMLTQILGNPDALLLEEWAELALRRNVRVDDVMVPQVLDWWARQPRRSEAIAAVLGPRGEWLASINETWRKPIATAAIPPGAEELWQTGRGPERLALLTTVRRHDPAQARALVESTWHTDAADDRRRFVDVLLEHCSMADEPFLEAALDDKSKTVRRQAAAVLKRLPGSRLRGRMAERARACIALGPARRQLLGRSAVRVVLAPPEAFDPAWARDGVEERAPDGVGQRAWWMTQMLAAADLSIWTEITRLPPAALLQALQEDDYFSSALDGLTSAAQSVRDPAWCGALVQFLLDRQSVGLEAIGGLMECLPEHTRESTLLEIATKAPLTPLDRWLLFAHGGRRWSEPFTAEALKLLRRYPPTPGAEAWRLLDPIADVSRLVAPSLFEVFEEVVTGLFAGQLPEGARRSVERVRLRADIHKEFAW